LVRGSSKAKSQSSKVKRNRLGAEMPFQFAALLAFLFLVVIWLVQ
jgi:hypothetical protein